MPLRLSEAEAAALKLPAGKRTRGGQSVTLPRVTLADHLEAALRLVLTQRHWPVREFQFAGELGRRWAFDIAWPGAYHDGASTYEPWLAVECEGGIWNATNAPGGKSRHTHGKGFRKDVDKYNAAVLLGWRLLRVTPDMIRDRSAVTLILKALRGR